jgi:tRNA-dihydrouridine synthase B
VQVQTILEHVDAIHAFYGESMGVRIARKHISWYTRAISVTGREAFWRSVIKIERAKEQVRALAAFLHSQVLVPEAA